MMFNRRNQILSAVLVLQIVLAVIVFWPKKTVSGSEPLLPGFEAVDVTALTIRDGEGNVTQLAKKEGNWVLPEADDFPALGDKISPVLEKMENLRTQRLVAENEASYRQLKVADDDYNRQVETVSGDGTVHDLYLGTSAGGASTHVRSGDKPQVYLTNELATWDVSALPSSWIDTLYFTVPQTATVALTLENDLGTFEFESDGDVWTMKGLGEDETLNQSSVKNLLSQVSSVYLMEPIGKSEQDWFGMDSPRAVVTLKTQDPETGKLYLHTLTVGARQEGDESQAGSGSYVVSSSQSPYFVRVTDYVGDNFVQKTREDFLELPPTPESTSVTE